MLNIEAIHLQAEKIDVNITVLCTNVMEGVARNQKSYLRLTLHDASGEIEARLWDSNPQDIRKWQAGQAYSVSGVAKPYQGKQQITINSYKKLDINAEDFKQFVPTAKIDAQNTYDFVIDMIANLHNPDYKTIMEAVFAEYGANFKTWPAAVRIHHNMQGGLLWHSSFMLKTAQALKNIYIDYEIDWELLYCGIILHDIGKILELSGDPANITMTTSGKLIGHISLMYGELTRIASYLDLNSKNSVIYLQHLVLASHGKHEFGSPVLPKLAEAEILSALDMLDARLFIINKELHKVQVNTETPSIAALEGRRLLRHFNEKT